MPSILSRTRHPDCASPYKSRLPLAAAVMLIGISPWLMSCGGSDASSNEPVGVNVSPTPVASPSPTASAPPATSTTVNPAPATSVGSIQPGIGSPSSLRPRLVISEGDSISVLWSGSYPGIFSSAYPAVPVVGMAVGGSGVGTVADRAAMGKSLWGRIDQVIAKRPSHVTVLIGANDLMSWQDVQYQVSDPSNWLAELFGYIQVLRAGGAQVAIATILPRCRPGAPSANEDLFEARRMAANAMIRDEVGKKVDFVIDFAANSKVGDRSDACDPTYYTDGVHPSGVGQQILSEDYIIAMKKWLNL